MHDFNDVSDSFKNWQIILDGLDSYSTQTKTFAHSTEKHARVIIIMKSYMTVNAKVKIKVISCSYTGTHCLSIEHL